ncbi:predicted protein [Postia placenta Mad-698-R]|nr:predicted protein [Postia placenta Mad-698-R]
MSPVVTCSQAREAASRSAAENLDSSSRTQSTPSPTIPGDFDRDEEDEIDQELQDDFDEEPIPSTAEECTSSPELLGLTTSDYDTSTPDLFEQSASNSNSALPAPTTPSTTTSSSSSPAPTNTTNMSQNTNTPLMPPRGHSTAPSFDPSEVRSLRRYFQDLEALFTQCQITDEAAKKQWAVRYPSIDVADLWETIESFIDVAKSYNDWKADVRALYPGADDTRKWSLVDMDQLIGKRARIGIHNAADLGCYYRDFMAITKHLIAQHRLSTIEQSRAFLRGFQPALLTRLETRLHLKHPDHYADDLYTMAEIDAAATFILHGTSSTPTTAANQATASTSNTSTTVPPRMIKTEDISMIIESLSRTIATLIQPTTHATHNHAPAPRQQAAVHVHENSGVEQTCHYCGNRGCRVGTCEFAGIDIRDGKCKRNTEGKIVLPNGSFCPRTIPGLTIRDRIYEWHRRNPAAPAAPTMLFEIDDRSTMQTFTLNTSSRIEALERELLQLRKRREVFDGVEILQRKKPTTTAVPKSAEASGSGTSKGVAAPSSTSTNTAPPPTIPAAAPASSSSSPTQSTSRPTTSAPPAPPVHPFANARDATYAPPNVRNFATLPKPSNDKGKEPAYKTIVPVIQPKLAEEIFQRSMKSPFVTLTPEELLSIAPDVRNKYRDAVTPKRVSTEPVASAHIIEIGADEVTAVNQLSCSGATLEPGATIVPDPYETYLKHIPHGEHPAEFTVARDSNAIRSIIALVDNKEQIECIVDPGSQIVAMSEEEDEIDQELQDDFDEEPIPSTAEECTSSPELLGLTTSDYDTSTPDLFEQSASNSNSALPAPTTPSTTTSSSSSPAPTNTTNMSQNTNTPLMPPRGHSTAPSFDPSEVRSLRRYFQDLEALFTQCQITDEAAKKQWAVRYPSIDVADLWETIESFIDVAKSYNDWKADVRALYPGADDTRKWSLVDMDQLIGKRARIGIHNAADLGCYYRDFMAITKHLIAQHRLSTIEQSRAFLRGFQPALLTRLETRLHLKHPDHYADDLYTMAEIDAAATFILHGTSSTPTTAANQATASTSNTSTTVPPRMIKTEDISMIIESLSRTIATLIQPTTHATHNHAPAPRQQAAVHVHENSGVEQTCHYCGNRGCRVGTCEFAGIDIRDGKCKRNTEGKIVLPNGSFCPRTIPGLTIRDRIYEWHRRNPAAPAAPTMLFEIDDRSTMQTFTLNTSSRIEALERELLQLRKRREVFDGVEILQRKKPTTTAVPKSAEASGSGTSKGVAAPSSTSTNTAPPPTIPAAAPASSSSSPTQSTSRPTTSAPPAPPVHPFANARDATYAPPNVRNFATLPKPSNDKGKEPAYKTIVPVIQPKLAEEIFQRSMKSPFVTLTPEELLSIAPDVRNKYRDAVTPKRVSTEPVASAHIIEIGADEVTAVNQLSCSGATLEPGATIVPDPYETYLKHIPHGEHPAEFTVARDSNAIRSIIALVDNKEQIECIVDPGSQIVAMSEEVCLGLNLLFDPTIQLNMQSANGEHTTSSSADPSTCSRKASSRTSPTRTRPLRSSV